MKKIRCRICGKKFEPKKNDMYIVEKECIEKSIFIKTKQLYECFDCPACGHQIPVSIREGKKNER